MSKSSMKSKISTLQSWLEGRKPVAVKRKREVSEPTMSDMPRFIKGMKR